MTQSAVAEQREAPSIRRHFLLLQGPCGPFFRTLQRSLLAQGQGCTRVALNGGDLVTSGFSRAILYTRSLADWPAWIKALAQQHGVTDLVVYGDCRHYHRLAIAILKPLGVRIHVLEEGYLRPNWVTCEPDGVNGNSALVNIDIDSLGGAVIEKPAETEEVELKGSHVAYMLAGFWYYLWTMLLTPLFPRYISHRDLDISGEAALWLWRLASWPRRRREANRTLAKLQALDQPLHLVLLQLNGDSQLTHHSSFNSLRHVVEYCMAEFAASRTAGQILVFKNHPLDNGVINLARLVREEAQRCGLEGRVFFVESPKLVPLLERSVTVTAVNSTACHQSLRRGIPTMVLGRAVFNHPQIVPRMRLADFFRLRPRTEIAHYEKLINLLRHTSQFNGGYYSRQGRDTLLPRLTAALIAGETRYERFKIETAGNATRMMAS